MSAEDGAVSSDSVDKGRALNPSSKKSGVSNGKGRENVTDRGKPKNK